MIVANTMTYGMEETTPQMTAKRKYIILHGA